METDRYESVIRADSWEKAIADGILEFQCLSEHDQKKSFYRSLGG